MKIDKINDEFIVNCTNNSKEERQQVYKFLVDNRNYEKSYLEDYFPVIVCNKKQDYSNWDSLEKYYTWVDSKKDIPIYTFEEFKKMYLDKFSLPVKWCVKDCKKVTEYGAKRFHHKMGDILEDTYLCIDESSGEYNYLKEKYNYTEITLEQFEKYVLNKNNMETKKIIGYKLVKPEYKEAAKKICNKDVKWTENDKFNLFTSENVSIPRLKEAGVLDLWFEPVYEEEFKVGDFIVLEYNTHRFSAKKGYVAKVIKEFDGEYIIIKWITDTDQIDGEYYPSDFRKATPEEIEKATKKVVKMYSSNKGEFEIEVIDGVAYYRPENKYLPKEWIRDIINSFGETIIWNTKKEKPYNVTISSLNVGCYHDCKKEDWENVYKLLK